MITGIRHRIGRAIRSRQASSRRKQAMRERDVASGIAIERFGEFDVAYRKGTADEHVLKDSFDNDVFFRGVPEYRPESGHIIIDVGAHIGTFSLLAASRARGGRVHAIEASGDTFNLLRINTALNRYDNIALHHLALTEHNGTVTLYHDSGNWGHSIVTPLSSSAETVEASTLTAFLNRHGIEHCDFIKFNCEGAEFPILLNTPAAILRRLRFMLVLYHCDLWDKHTESDLVDWLKGAGFLCEIRQRTADRGWLIADQGSRTAEASR